MIGHGQWFIVPSVPNQNARLLLARNQNWKRTIPALYVFGMYLVAERTLFKILRPMSNNIYRNAIACRGFSAFKSIRHQHCKPSPFGGISLVTWLAVYICQSSAKHIFQPTGNYNTNRMCDFSAFFIHAYPPNFLFRFLSRIKTLPKWNTLFARFRWHRR